MKKFSEISKPLSEKELLKIIGGEVNSTVGSKDWKTSKRDSGGNGCDNLTNCLVCRCLAVADNPDPILPEAIQILAPNA